MHTTDIRQCANTIVPDVNNLCNKVVSNQPVCEGKPWSGTWCILDPCLPRNCQTSTCACTWNIYIHRSNVFYPGTAFFLRSSFGPVQMNLKNTNIWNFFVIEYTITYMKYWKLQMLELKMHLENFTANRIGDNKIFYWNRKKRHFISLTLLMFCSKFDE